MWAGKGEARELIGRHVPDDAHGAASRDVVNPELQVYRDVAAKVVHKLPHGLSQPR